MRELKSLADGIQWSLKCENIKRNASLNLPFLAIKRYFFYQKQASESMMKVSFKTFTIYLPLPGQFS